ncbi:MAG: hypothetical protein KDD48_02690 [Bdellovibrionales bacterium]|nr:hypothetical protein [Bdellovibrionales bacterium]
MNQVISYGLTTVIALFSNVFAQTECSQTSIKILGVQFSRISPGRGVHAIVKHPNYFNPEFRKVSAEEIIIGDTPLFQRIDGDSGCSSDNGQLVAHNPSDSRTDPANSLNFNCHAYSLSFHPSLSACIGSHTWVDGYSHFESLWTNPAETLFSTFYEKIQSQDRGYFDEASLFSRVALGDVIMFRDTKVNKMIHSAVVSEIREAEIIMVTSKLGKGPLVKLTLQGTMDIFENRSWDMLELYRVQL